MTTQIALRLALVAAAAVLLATSAHAVPRTFVFSTGNDANTCERTAPCRTFAGALAKTDAKGEIVVLDSGQYGLVNITKAVRITAVGVVAAIEAPFGTAAVTVNVAPADVVVLTGLTLSGREAADTGISYTGRGTLRVEDCTVIGFSEEGISFAGAGQLFVQDTAIRNNKSYGIHVAPDTGTATAVIDHCKIESDRGGLRVDGPAGTTARVMVRDSTAACVLPFGFPTDGSAGYSANGPAAQMNVVDSEALYNDVGFKAEGGAKVEARNCAASNNRTGGFSVSSGAVISAKECRAANNRNGMSASDAASKIIAKGCQLVNNSRGLLVSAGGTGLISDSTVTSNETGLENSTDTPGTLKSFVNNRVHGNTTNTVGTVTTVSQM